LGVQICAVQFGFVNFTVYKVYLSENRIVEKIGKEIKRGKHRNIYSFLFPFRTQDVK
jgi:hypothetical protein